uniref:Wall-associated receptor kinase galacturonan-binding domain-containing protein n=1 Tax=Ananas comosus var. bracteatus TaxID=296719 RepID=A0A6V7Q687_ANACO|nr:unnamed protein product [Ananas comosus var. bracteatus]
MPPPLLLLTCVGVAEGRKKHVSCFSSCGHLHDIGYPFRLKSDLPGCGSPNYELLCDSGKPMLELGSAKYYITNISYKNMTISVIDPVFVNDNKYCPLPLQSPPPDFSYLYDDVGGYWALFVNCTRPIHDGTYQRGPNCLSSNNSFVYVVADMWGIVEPIKPSCGFLASIPMSVRQFNPNNTDIFELLKEGFMLSWDVGRETSSAIFHECLNEAKSFGMLLLEMAGGRRNVDKTMENTSQVYYPSWIYDQLAQNNGIIEINNNMEIHEIERKLCKVGLWCIQMKSSNRPSMDKVVEMLEGDTDNLQMPPRPSFHPRSRSLQGNLPFNPLQ